MNQEQPPTAPQAKWLPYVVLAAILVLAYMVLMQPRQVEPEFEIPYSQFKEYVTKGQVVSVQLQGDVARGELRGAMPIGPRGESGEHFHTRLPAFGDEELLPLLESQDVKINVQPEAEPSPLLTLAISFLPWIILLVFFYWLYKRSSRTLGEQMGGGVKRMQDFLETSVKEADIPKISFEDVAGQENAKREVAELVEYLKHPELFEKLGAEVPRGVLLMGPPGTGKTLMARALAGEAGVPFYTISASEFIEIFVGVGAARVRRLFEAAKKNTPSIIFIDELDSVGRTRGTGLGGGHDEREQTLNQILAEMDGFAGHEAVIVLAATNRPDVLDPALLRPGRFDRHVTLDMPDLKDRLALLMLHSRKVPLAGDVDLKKIAAGTPGFSGADIKNLVNEAAMCAAREHQSRVTMAHFDESRDRLLMGNVRTLAIQPEERHRLAIHEAGHTLVAYYLPHADPLYKVTIIPRGQALGGTQQLPDEERHTLPEEYLRDRLALMLAGRAAEKEYLDSVSSGADDDIRQATNLARAMVSRWGMSKEVGPVDLRESEEHPFLGRRIAQPRSFSEHSAEAVDRAVHDLLLHAEETAADIIRKHRGAMDRLIGALEEHETLTREQIEHCLGPKSADAPPETGA